MARIMALDWGTKYIGVAVSDELQISTRPLAPLTVTSPDALLSEIQFLCKNFNILTIVIGLPLSLSREAGPQAQKVLEFADAVEAKTGIEVVLWDETYTSQAAEDSLKSSGKDVRKNRAEVNSIAAQHILESYLSEHYAVSSKL